MQAIPVIAGLILVGLMAASGFQLVPESSLRAANTTSLSGGGVQINTERSTLTQAPQAELVSEVVVDSTPVITAVTIKQPQNIERNTATLRGRIVVGPEQLGSVFFIYGYDLSDLKQAVIRSADYDQVIANMRPSVQTKRVLSNIRSTRDVTARVGGLAVEAKYYVQLCIEVQAALRCSDVGNFETLDGPSRAGDVRIPTISIRDTAFTSGEEIIFEVGVNMRDTDEGLVYILYGESRSAVEDSIQEEYRDIDEDEEDLQKQRIDVRVIGSQTYTVRVDDLDDNRQHFYAACVQYDGRRDGVVCTRVGQFTTPDDSFGDAPRVRTQPVQVSGNTITLQGYIDMRSFRNGQAFFVYGTDSNAVLRAEEARSMTSIRQNSDRIQRVLVDGDVDFSGAFRTAVPDLRFSTPYTARLCIEFKNEDERGRDRLFVECGEVQSFTTN